MNNLIEYSNSLSIEIDLPDETLLQEVTDVFAAKIKMQKPALIKKRGNTIYYTAGMMRFVFNINLLYCISEGEISLVKDSRTLTVFYVIRFYELFALSIIPAVAALIVIDSLALKIIGCLSLLLINYGAKCPDHHSSI